MVRVPEIFLPKADFKHPAYIQNYFEEWFFDKYVKGRYIRERLYLPVFWTTYYIKNGFKTCEKLQAFLNSLDRSKKYFTVIQYDDGILENIDGLDIKVFSSGGKGDIPIPLLADGITLQPKPWEEKDILCSFVGSNTHPIRQKMYDELHDKEGFQISFEKKSPEEYLDIINRSKFTLCPRGYGKTSFRLYEAIALRSVPFYITDEPWIPYTSIAQGIFPLIDEEHIYLLPNLIKKFPYKLCLENRDMMLKTHFTYEGVFNYILKTLSA